MSAPAKSDRQPGTFSHPRLDNEYATIATMTEIYCKTHHGGNDTLCKDCKELLSYAKKRLQSCPFQENKPTCGKCDIHCYKKSMQKKIKKVMSFAGPRMIYRHPILALFHLIDGRRSTPRIKKK